MAEPQGGAPGAATTSAGAATTSAGDAAPAAEAPAFTKSEMMIVAAARELAGQRVCFVGVGLPNIAVNLAKRTVAPDMELVYEAGVFGAEPARLPLSIGDPTIVTGSTAVVSMWELFAYYLQGGLVDVGFLGAAQIDRFGNLNSTVIGDYARPKTRLPGAGGASEIATHAKQTFVVLKQSPRSFVPRLDFRTSAGFLEGAGSRDHSIFPGAGPQVVITDYGVLKPEPGSDELQLVARYENVDIEAARQATGWPLKVANQVEVIAPPSVEELRTLRDLHERTRRAHARPVQLPIRRENRHEV